MKSDNQWRPLTKVSFPSLGLTGMPVSHLHASLQILTWAPCTHRSLPGCRGPRWLNTRHTLTLTPGSWPRSCVQMVHNCSLSASLHPQAPVSPAQVPHYCIMLCTDLGAWRCSLALSAHEQLPRKKPARNQPQPLLSSQTLQGPEKQSKMRASHGQPASGKGSISYISSREATCPKQ